MLRNWQIVQSKIQDVELSTLLAVLAYNFNVRSEASSFDRRIFSALVVALAKNNIGVESINVPKLKNSDVKNGFVERPNGVRIEPAENGGLHVKNNGVLVTTLWGHQAQVNQIAFSNAGDLMATSAKDNTIRIWNVYQINRLPLVITENELISNLTFSDDGCHIFYNVGKIDKTIRSQPLKMNEMAAKLCTVIKRNLTAGEWEFYVAGDLEYDPVCQK